MTRSRPAEIACRIAMMAAATGCASGATQVPMPDANAVAPPSGALDELVRESQERPSPGLAPLPRAPSHAPSLALPPPSPSLGRFLALTDELRAGRLDRHLRIGFFGDSHIQADFWTGTVRRALARDLGDGGLGFVHPGWPGYRHDGVRIERRGNWRVEPQPMTTGERQGDGIYGLLGVRIVGESESGATLTVTDGPTRPLRFDIAYRLPTCPTRVRMTVNDGPGSARRAEDRLLVCAEASEAGPIEHLEIITEGESPTVDIEVQEGQLELFGVVLETLTPGVVVDALGISGARADTPLAWDKDAYVHEVERRNYDLLVLAYGTNDSVPANPATVPAFGRYLNKLLVRLRESAPEADCLIIGPMDRGPLKRRNVAKEDRILELNEEAWRLADKEGCAFFSALEAMGGLGTIRAWAKEAPPLAQSDLVHLTRAGYARLGDQLVDFLGSLRSPSPSP